MRLFDFLRLPLLALFACNLTGFGQEATPAETQSLATLCSNTRESRERAPDLQNCVLAPGDVIRLDDGFTDWPQNETIPTDGMIAVTFLGKVQAGGLTPSQLEKSLNQKLLAYYRESRMKVYLPDVRSNAYSIAGNVARPGTFTFESPLTVAEAIHKAGGLLGHKIVIIRGSKRLTLLSKRQGNDAFVVNGGDTILVY